jgi:hypothetical protein
LIAVIRSGEGFERHSIERREYLSVLQGYACYGSTLLYGIAFPRKSSVRDETKDWESGRLHQSTPGFIMRDRAQVKRSGLFEAHQI